MRKKTSESEADRSKKGRDALKFDVCAFMKTLWHNTAVVL